MNLVPVCMRVIRCGIDGFMIKNGIVLKKLGIDRDIGVTILYRLWTIIAGGILLIIIPVFLSPEEQGYYFTFSSLIALQVFFELGFNFVLTQTVGHEMAKNELSNGLKLTGPTPSVNRIRQLIFSVRSWYTKISFAFFFTVLLIGLFFFHGRSELPMSTWLPIWFTIVLLSGVNLFCSPFFSIIEGFGLVANVAKIRLIQSIVGYSLFILFVMMGAGLYALPFISGCAAIISSVWLLSFYRKIIFIFQDVNEDIINCERITWKKDIFPFQWKLAISWFSGYLIFQLFNPMLFLHQGSVVAGKVGLTLTIFSTILSVSMSWITAKTPLMGRLVAERKFGELNKIFRNLIIKSGLFNFSLLIGFFFILCLFKYHGFSIANRLTDIRIISLIILVSIVNHAIFSFALYMRAFKQEPLLTCSVVSGIVTGVLVYIGSIFSDFITIALYAVVTCCISFPWASWVFFRFIKKQ